MDIDKGEVARLTAQCGGAWGINHTRRLLHLVEIIGQDLAYDSDAVWLAAHLHDWGAYAPWAQPGVDHVQRSREVAEAFLNDRSYPDDFRAVVLECIALHHTGGSDRSLEAILLRDADVLDFLGVVGILRDFSKTPRDLRKAYEVTCKRRDTLPGVVYLDKAKAIAADRVDEMNALLKQFEADSFGCF